MTTCYCTYFYILCLFPSNSSRSTSLLLTSNAFIRVIVFPTRERATCMISQSSVRQRSGQTHFVSTSCFFLLLLPLSYNLYACTVHCIASNRRFNLLFCPFMTLHKHLALSLALSAYSLRCLVWTGCSVIEAQR